MGTAVYAYPWNVHDTSAFAGRVTALGADEVTLAVSYHAGKFIQPGDPEARVYFPEDGTIYFRPCRGYGAILPQVSALTQGRDVLAELCERDDIGVNAWTVLNHNTRLGMARPDLCARNAFGDGYPYSLCPSQPEVRAYAVTLCADIAEGYGVRRLLLESPGWLTYGHGYHHEFAQVAPEPWLDALLGLCFCDRCRTGAAAAGIDADGLAGRVRQAVDVFLDGETPVPSLEAWTAADPDLSAFHAFRCEVVTSLMVEIRAEVRPDVAVKVISTCQHPHATAWLEGHDLAALDAASDGLELPLYQPNAAAVLADGRYVLERVSPARTSVILRPGHPDLTTEAALVAALDGLKAQGITDFAFYNLGMLRPADLRRLQHVLTRQVAHV
ncbi:MAG: hypothetical protein WDN06_02845 [Asticcacaulis sp.]